MLFCCTAGVMSGNDPGYYFRTDVDGFTYFVPVQLSRYSNGTPLK